MSLLRKTLFLHFGESAIRGSEVCLIESLHALVAAGGAAVLLCNHPAVFQGVLPESVSVEFIEFPELMIDGAYKSLPVMKYLRQLWSLRRRFHDKGFRLIYANGGLPCQLGWPLSKLIGAPLLAHFHHPSAKRYFYVWLVRFADRIIVPSQYTGSVVREKCGRESSVVYNGVNVQEKFKPEVRASGLRADLGFDDTHVVIGQVGALVEHKRADLLIEAFGASVREMPNLRLVLAGDGRMKAHLERQIESLGLSGKVRILGRVPDVVPYYQHVLDINVLASECEGLGISVIEASACGLPSVVSDSTGLLEVVQDDVTGFHFKTGDAKELARTLLKLARSSELRSRLGRSATEFARQKFSNYAYREAVVAHIRALGGLDP